MAVKIGFKMFRALPVPFQLQSDMDEVFCFSSFAYTFLNNRTQVMEGLFVFPLF